MLGHVNSSAHGQTYTIKINTDFLMRLLKRGELYIHRKYGGFTYNVRECVCEREREIQRKSEIDRE